MDTASFAEQYIALSRATGSVCDAFGNRVELNNIPKLLHKLSRGQFKLVWSDSFCARDHVALERMDSSMSWAEMIDLLDANKDRHRSEFLHWHMQITSTVWGQWKYSICGYDVHDCGVDSKTRSEWAVVRANVLRSGEAAMVWGGRRGDYRDP